MTYLKEIRMIMKNIFKSDKKILHKPEISVIYSSL